MAEFAPAYRSARLESRGRQKRMCQRLVQITCVFFIPVVLVRRALDIGMPRPKGRARLSILADARASASAVIPFIFMG